MLKKREDGLSLRGELTRKGHDVLVHAWNKCLVHAMLVKPEEDSFLKSIPVNIFFCTNLTRFLERWWVRAEDTVGKDSSIHPNTLCNCVNTNLLVVGGETHLDEKNMDVISHP